MYYRHQQTMKSNILSIIANSISNIIVISDILNNSLEKNLYKF